MDVQWGDEVSESEGGEASTQQTSHVPHSFQNILFHQNQLLIQGSLNVFSIDTTLLAYLHIFSYFYRTQIFKALPPTPYT